MSEMQERIDDYLTFGVRYVWVLDPRTRRAYVHTIEGSREVRDELRTENPNVVLPLRELFSELGKFDELSRSASRLRDAMRPKRGPN